MGPDEDTSARIRRSTEHVADAVHRRLEADFAHPVKEPLTRFHILGRKGGTYDTGVIFPNGPEVFQVIYEPLGINFRHDIRFSIYQLGLKLFPRRRSEKVAPAGQQAR
jgi:hypothetical protein